MHDLHKIDRRGRRIPCMMNLCRMASNCGKLFVFSLWAITSSVCAADAPATFSAEELQFFENDIAPLLKANCFKCHGGDEVKGGLKLTSRATILTGGESGAAVDLDDRPASLLLEAINYESFEMPPTGKMPREAIAKLTKWVEMGLPMPAGEIATGAAHAGPPEVNEETKNHWSFRPVRRPDVPAVKNTDWVVNPIDAFILARLEEAGLQPNRPAEPGQLVRRVHYDLLGLPPSPDDVTEFADNPTPEAYRALVEQLLDSPHYGEHWARYWLDVVRYAESNSYERDNPKPFVWRYRDYVIDAFNDDKPYDQFIREQLAGDELETVTTDGIVATGFYRLGLWDDEPVDPELAFFDGLDDMAATTAQAFLGLTMNCARCHSHKLDPIPQEDYYRFIAFFRNVRHYGVRGDDTVYAASIRSIATPEEEAELAAEKEVWGRHVAELRQQLDDVENALLPQLPGPEQDDFKNDSVRLGTIRKHVGELISQEDFDAYARLRKDWTETRNRPPRSASQALCITENGSECPPTFVLARGNPQAKGDEVQPGFPTVLSAPNPVIDLPQHGESCGRRLALAEWIASPDNPLAARVMVNRIWQWHFGRGIVESANNFGLQGDAPTHPELLDWLAAEFMENGWSIKELSRLILASNTYRMSSATNDVAFEQDPTNRLFWRFDMRRLRAEEVRDSILAVNGSLNLDAMYGPSIYTVIPPEVLAGQSRPGAGWGNSSPKDRARRSVYIHVKRSLQVPILAAFDAADTDNTCPVRFATTQPTQALSLLNSTFLNEQAQVFAEYVRQHAGESAADRVAFALRQATQRTPSAADVERGVGLIASLQADYKLSDDAALKYFCLLALNLNEFMYLD